MRNVLHLVRWVFVLIISCVAGRRAQAQAPSWQLALPVRATVAAAVTDANGNVYLTGSFRGSATFGSIGLSANSSSNTDMFVAKWSPALGAFAWAVRGGGMGVDAGQGIAVGGSNVYVSGSFQSSTATFGSVALTNADASAATTDVYVSKLNAETGAYQWAQRAGGPGSDTAPGLVATSSGLYVGGVFGGTTAAFGATTLSIRFPGSTGSAYLARLTDAGTTAAFAWALAGGATGTTEFGGLAGSGNALYLAYNFTGTAGFSNLTVANTDASGASSDLALVKVNDVSGGPTIGWLKQAGGPANDYVTGLAANGANVYLTGGLSSATAAFDGLTLNLSSGPVYVAKLSDAGTSGAFVWSQQIGGSGAYAAPYRLAVQDNGVYVAGGFTGATISAGSTTLTNTLSTTTDAVVAKLTDVGSTGAFAWAVQAGGSGNEQVSAVAVSPNGSAYVGGSMGGTASFGGQTVSSTDITGAPVASGGFVAYLPSAGPVLNLVAPSTAPVGGTIALYGRQLTGATSVTFSGGATVSAGFTVNAAGTQLSGVVVPAGAQSGPVLVTTPNGVSNGVVYTLGTANPAPAWQGLAAASTGPQSTVRYAVTAANGDVLISGTFAGSLTLGSTTLTSQGALDVFVAKWSPASGSYVWAVSAGSAQTDAPLGLGLNGSNIYVAGQVQGPTMTLGSVTLTNTEYAGFVTKLVDNGSSASFVWAEAVRDGSYVFLQALAVNGNDVFIGGDYTGAALTVAGGTISGNASEDDGFVVKLTDNGNSASYRWGQRMGNALTSTTDNWANVYGLAVQGSNVYLTAFFVGTVDFGNQTLSSAGGYDVAVVRLADAGSSSSFTAALRLGGAGNDGALYLSARGNALYASGQTSNPSWTGATPSGTGTGFVARVDDAGAAGLRLAWVQLAGITVLQTFPTNAGLYAAGSFGLTGTFGATTYVSAGHADGMLLRLEDRGSSASIAWVQTAGGPGADVFYSVAVSGTNVYAAGYTTPASAFGSLVLTAPASAQVAVLAALTDVALPTQEPRTAATALGLYPNPAHGRATVKLPASSPAGPLMLLDGMGREVRRVARPGSAPEVELDLRGLAAGLYVVRCGGLSQRLLVE
ncbi:T9SS type A sorting domain-containing protein [Hymenobacter sp. 15J16-1T3B]|uniref:T9SS type A sorting domain-containing protein n=1 Tax=Hymenobacter sp. 15J16-1T3B TaxID=2886941 RepID=UPI001D124F2A|nr:T9SS type A sorting domain-containing protein [Hymenobacter sp. 15J16-1T3B]MCC3159365.1 T9SS type A sorting domain-containing protein [Hymenobacter sp. 15J16-1T3B]